MFFRSLAFCLCLYFFYATPSWAKPHSKAFKIKIIAQLDHDAEACIQANQREFQKAVTGKSIFVPELILRPNTEATPEFLQLIEAHNRKRIHLFSDDLLNSINFQNIKGIEDPLSVVMTKLSLSYQFLETALIEDVVGNLDSLNRDRILQEATIAWNEANRLAPALQGENDANDGPLFTHFISPRSMSTQKAISLVVFWSGAYHTVKIEAIKGPTSEEGQNNFKTDMLYNFNEVRKHYQDILHGLIDIYSRPNASYQIYDDAFSDYFKDTPLGTSNAFDLEFFTSYLRESIMGLNLERLLTELDKNETIQKNTELVFSFGAAHAKVIDDQLRKFYAGSQYERTFLLCGN